MALNAARASNAAANFAGRHAVVVGGTSGIGHGIAVRLAKANFAVTVIGRNAAAAEQVLAEMRQANSTAPHEFLPCDAQLLSNVHQCATEYTTKHPNQPVDVLVLTQGIATTQGRTETSEGLDQKMSLHYYSRMAFIDAFLPQLRNSVSPRVMSVLSAGVHSPYKQYASDPELKQNYSLKNAADAAGFYNDVGLDALSREEGNQNIVFAHAAPGFVKTNWGREMPTVIRWLVRAVQPFGKSKEDCAELLSTVLLKPDEQTKGGFYLLDQNGQPAKPTKLHEEARESIWTHTRQVLSRLLK
jgi:NAD(P)-dependent dehydrogenase (short-subunit alcohol dehydrogenase family)